MRYLDQSRIEASVINLVDRPGEASAIVSEAKNRGHSSDDFYTGGRFNPLTASRLARLVRQSGTKILHSHGYKSDVMALIAGTLAGIKVVSTSHGWSKERDKKLVIYEQLDKICLRFFDHLCPLSTDLYSGFRRAGIIPSKITLIQNGVDIQEIDEAPLKPGTNGKKRIGFIGQFIERKRVEDLIDAFFLLRRTDCELFLIGDGPCRQNIFHRIHSRNGDSLVHCPGFSTNRLEYLKGFDLFVLPSLIEGIPRCIMEAHAARVPVVGTDIAGTRELVKHEQTGLLAPPRNPAKLAEAMDRILESPELGAKLASAGRKLVEEEFSAEKMAKRYEAFYFSL